MILFAILLMILLCFFVIFIECLVITRIFLSKWFDKKIYTATVLTNVISGIIGIIISMILKSGWHLIGWFPLVSIHEASFQTVVMFYVAAFILTTIIETIINFLFFRNQYPVKKIIIATLSANTFSYVVGTMFFLLLFLRSYS